MIIKGARFGNPANTAIIVDTEEDGEKLINAVNHTELWNEVQGWAASGGEIAAADPLPTAVELGTRAGTVEHSILQALFDIETRLAALEASAPGTFGQMLDRLQIKLLD